ncbi:nitrogenase component 1 [Calderihabitans maritimus]|uniref:Nitrogenase n=1 Tax=Calderihabitans maritimus TaxID=1246530 RepID=A0A1Z5HWZ9_9FIRM|nr:nitrogenase component 1 [Calderihabitans maritimus]GAW93887.1 nitrogenase [Calderihabitans maritimus]
MKLTTIPIEGIPYDRLKIDKIPLSDQYIERDPQLVPAANRAVVINPCRTCMPLGAMFATLGVHRGIPFVQGAQGCTTYVRYTFCRIFKEPAAIATASFHEDAAVFGGMKNFVEGIRNLVVRYWPGLIGVVTTCSSEIIGDDMVSFIKMARQKLVKELGEEKAAQVKIVLINTPSFAGSHVVGYDRASKAFIETLVHQKTKPNNKINIIPGMLNPGDIREIKHLLEVMGVESIILFDISDVFDAPLRPPQKIPYYPKGGTRIEEIEDMANSLGTIALCPHEGGLGAQYLERKSGVRAIIGPPPIGVRNTDLFLQHVSELTGKSMPEELLDERGRLLDFMADTFHHTMMKKVAIFGDPDIVVGVTRFACELGMDPVAVLSGTPSKTFTGDIEEIAAEYNCSPKIFNGSDLFEFEEYLKKINVDLIIGNCKGIDIARELEVPLIRVGLMVWDRVGYQKRPVVGYRGGEFLLAEIANAILDYKYPDDRTQQL